MKASSWILGSLLLAGAAHAQTDQAQLMRPQAASQLNGNLSRLASNPRDVAALIGAGEAALELDDARAAAGFFARADAVTPNNGRVKAGLARVMLKLQNPAEALRLFDLATKAGYPEATILSDRALARDMTGDQAGAQRDYQQALRATPADDELVRRYAASLGISGQVDASDKILQPLLYKSDRAAWRYRAFILAMNNRQAEAKKIADQTLPAQLAAAIVPYMQKMPYLTGAQKAAALHFGHFPQQVGTRIAAIIPTPAAPVGSSGSPSASQSAAVGTALASADARRPSTTASGDTRRMAGSARDRLTQPVESRATRRAASRLAQADTRQPVPKPTPAPVPSVQPLPSQPAPSQPAPSQPTPSQTQPTPPATAAVQGPPAPGFDTLAARPSPTSPAPTTTSPEASPAAVAQAPAATSTPVPPPAATPPRQQPNPEATRTLADIIRAIDVPDVERQQRVAAVDLTEIANMQAARRAQQNSAAEKAKQAALAKAKAEAAAKAKKEAEEKKRLAANPSRNWLQVGTGANKGALGFTMKGLRRKYDSLAPQDAWTAAWGRTNRLLIGPFSSFSRAKTLEDKLKAAGADVFAWQSDAGEVVEKLGGD